MPARSTPNVPSLGLPRGAWGGVAAVTAEVSTGRAALVGPVLGPPHAVSEASEDREVRPTARRSGGRMDTDVASRRPGHNSDGARHRAPFRMAGAPHVASVRLTLREHLDLRLGQCATIDANLVDRSAELRTCDVRVVPGSDADL